MFWNWYIFLRETNNWAQGEESTFAPLAEYNIKEALGCTYKELYEEPYEHVFRHMKIKERIDHYAKERDNADRGHNDTSDERFSL